jgi:Tfp pilus assembly protein PilN
MRAVNLLPENAYAPKQRLPHAPVVLAATVPVLAGALVYLGYSLEHSQVVDRQTTLGVVQSQIAELGPSPELVAKSSTVQSERIAREAALQDALSKRVPWDVTFDRLARLLPDGSWLTSLTAQSPTPSSGEVTTSTTTNPTGFTAAGYADTHDTIALILSRLSLVPGLTNVALTSTTSTTIGSKHVVQFNITAQVTGGSS